MLYTRDECSTITCFCQQSKQTNARLPPNYPVLGSAVLFLIMVWPFIAFHCIVSNTSCCIFQEVLHNRYSSSINNNKGENVEFPFVELSAPWSIPGAILGHNKELFSWLSNFATSLASRVLNAQADVLVCQTEGEKTTLCQGTESYPSPAFRENNPLWAVIGSSDCESARGGATLGAGPAAFRWHRYDSEEERKQGCFNQYSRTPWNTLCWRFWPVKPQPLWS